MKNKIEEAEYALQEGDLFQCEQVLNEIVESNGINIEVLLLRAKCLYKQQKWGETLNILNQIIEIQENHEAAHNYKKMVLNILNFSNKDQYNP